jgi:hypothetical protein
MPVPAAAAAAAENGRRLIEAIRTTDVVARRKKAIEYADLGPVDEDGLARIRASRPRFAFVKYTGEETIEVETFFRTWCGGRDHETTGNLKKDGYLFFGCSGEEYVVSNIAGKYERVGDTDRYRPAGGIRACVDVSWALLLRAGWRLPFVPVSIETPWGAPMVVRLGDMLVIEEKNEDGSPKSCYRVRGKEARVTYEDVAASRNAVLPMKE